MALKLCTRLRDNGLFFTASRDKRITKEKIVASCGAKVSGITCPTDIKESIQLKWEVQGKMQYIK